MCCKNVIDIDLLIYLFIYSKLSPNTLAGCYYSTTLCYSSFLKNPSHFTGTNY